MVSAYQEPMSSRKPVSYPQKMNALFNSEEGVAGWDWWLGFKARYVSVMRQPENLSINIAQASPQENIESSMTTWRKDFGRQGLSINRRELGT